MAARAPARHAGDPGHAVNAGHAGNASRAGRAGKTPDGRLKHEALIQGALGERA